MARRVARELDKILDGGDHPRQAAVARAAAELRLTTRQIYNLLARYRDDRTVTALLPRTATSRRKRLPEQAEEIIAATLREKWLTLEPTALAPVVDEIRARCEEAGVAVPSYVTVARRIPMLFSPEEIAKKRSANPKHLLRLKPRPGYIHAPHPLAVFNFVEVVDAAGVFVGRLYLTVILPDFGDDPQRVLLSFLPGTERRLSPEGISMFAMHYYSPWLGVLVPEGDRLQKLEVRYDPRDISHIYVRDPETRQFRPVERRDGQLTPVTLWEQEAERTCRRTTNQRSNVEKVAVRREIAAIAETAKPSKRQLRDSVRKAHAAAAEKPYAVMQPPAPLPAEHPPRRKSRLPVEDW
ncbi:Mu transposase C-terminal domain-containing protein [Rhizobium sp. MC62]|nr:Mu transposase C-terminal domain-containing protein [Rhizobium sp. MC62]MDC9813084.1 Mu transposase C-terminal domain-containing protein [Rhizobium sp. MC62]